MQITELKSEDFLKEYEVTVPNSVVEESVEEKIKEAAKTFKMPGFREGTVPISMVRQKLKKDELSKEVNKQIIESIQKIREEKKINFISNPEVKNLSLTEQDGLKMSLVFELLPEIPQIAWENITLDKLIVKISDKEISDAHNIIFKDFRSYEDAKSDYAVKYFDKVNLSYSATINGQNFEGNTAEKIDIMVGENSFSVEFEQKLIGAKKGDKLDFSASFSQNYPQKDLAGKSCDFKVEIHSISTLKPLEKITDDMLKKFDFESEEKLNESIKSRMENDFLPAARNYMKKNLFDVLDKEYKINIPKRLVDRDFDELWKEIEKNMDKDPQLKGKSPEALKEEYRKVSERRVRIGLIIANIIGKNNITASDEELVKIIESQASQLPTDSKQQVLNFYKDRKNLEKIRGPFLEDKAVDLVLSKIKSNDVHLTPEEFNKKISQGL